MSNLDILFVNANDGEINYQSLANKFMSFETPIWCGMLANAVRNKGFSTSILDCEVEQFDTANSAKEIININPRLVVMIAQGQNPNNSTTKMEGMTSISKKIKEINPNQKIVFLGSHVAALPRETLATERSCDFICQNEGVYTLLNLLKVQDLNDESQLHKVKGLGFRTKEYKTNLLNISDEYQLAGNSNIVLNEPERIVPRESLEQDLPRVLLGIFCLHQKNIEPVVGILGLIIPIQVLSLLYIQVLVAHISVISA